MTWLQANCQPKPEAWASTLRTEFSIVSLPSSPFWPTSQTTEGNPRNTITNIHSQSFRSIRHLTRNWNVNNTRTVPGHNSSNADGQSVRAKEGLLRFCFTVLVQMNEHWDNANGLLCSWVRARHLNWKNYSCVHVLYCRATVPPITSRIHKARNTVLHFRREMWHDCQALPFQTECPRRRGLCTKPTFFLNGKLISFNIIVNKMQHQSTNLAFVII